MSLDEPRRGGEVGPYHDAAGDRLTQRDDALRTQQREHGQLSHVGWRVDADEVNPRHQSGESRRVTRRVTEQHDESPGSGELEEGLEIDGRKERRAGGSR